MAELPKGVADPYLLRVDAMDRLTSVREITDLIAMPFATGTKMLDELGLGVFHGDGGTYWIGFTEPQIAVHDRWIAMCEGGHQPKRRWRLVFAEAIEIKKKSERVGSKLESDKVVQQLMLDYAATGWVNEYLVDLGRPKMPRSTIAVLMNLFGTTDVEQLAGVRGERDLADLHLLVHHHDAWVARHPEAAGVPKELVWRMQGLQSMLWHASLKS